MFAIRASLAGLVTAVVCAASPTSGTLYFTRYSGTPNVSSITYNWDGTTFSLGTETAIASLSGADGIIFDPSGNLLVGKQGASVAQLTTGGSVITNATSNPNGAFHLTLDPSGTAVYANAFGGGLSVHGFSAGVLQNGANYSIFGDDTGITSEAYAPGGPGWLYVNGQPNGGGNVGTLDLSNLSNIQTTRFASGVQSAHGLVYDSFTGLFTMFGRGYVGTVNPQTHAIVEYNTGVCDFDQGAVDGQGHALIAGCNGITFIDYSLTGSITSASNFISFNGGFSNIDDVAPLSGAGSQAPEPATFFLIGGALFAVGVRRRFRA